ncbi:hypothetical protein PAAG_07912 [Paracoccidioides lutzii Pb01]|uniref:HNH nuclease domain-containing protein n=1 Tax=Paracoccidioides lutzii (strain ATCC MYA-826 / Pb01) TaxID=502779 RepID=C1HAT3_PARBA|nr:hypothetical protein PAAG_07912 [Paracoccidioides lutzii Pb01]EEH37494.1 hypothetical protein PAAG_07912 [Paracoccidioides lutzii Pb01]
MDDVPDVPDIPKELEDKEILFSGDFTAAELSARAELYEKINVAVNGYMNVPFGSWDCLTFQLREINCKIRLNELECRVSERIFAPAEDSVEYARKMKHYREERLVYFGERDRLGREMWHLFRNTIGEKPDAKRAENRQAKFADLVLSLTAEITPEEQQTFVANLENAYCLEGSPEGEVWCPIAVGWMKKSDVGAAHIFPTIAGQGNMALVFAEGPDIDVNGAKNGLFLPPRVKEAFEKFQIVIVPEDVGANPPEFEFRVLDASVHSQMGTQDMTFNELNKRKLIFQPENSFRPSLQYLHFHFAVAMLLRSRRGGASEKLPDWVTSGLRGVWEDPTIIICEDLLLGFVQALEAYWEESERDRAEKQRLLEDDAENKM